MAVSMQIMFETFNVPAMYVAIQVGQHYHMGEVIWLLCTNLYIFKIDCFTEQARENFLYPVE